MGRLQQVAAFGLAACVALGGGCIHVHRDAEGKLKGIDAKAPAGPVAPKAPDAAIDPAVKQAAATIPAQTTASVAALSKLVKTDLPKGAATEIALTWMPKVGYLPDPTHNGEMIAGLVGQMFLFGPGYQADETTGVVMGLRPTFPTLRARQRG